LHQILDGHGQVSICSLSDRALRHFKPEHTSSGMGLTRQKPSVALARSRVGRRTW
jgi:hypothetical protein